MYSILIFLVYPIWAVNCEIHSLTYIYTAFSKPVDLPGIHEFTAMGLLDDRMIDYYDSSLKKKIPKQPWMEERLEKDYWDKGTQSRQSKEQWFKVNLGILRDRMRHGNDTDLHVLQWRHGCKAETQQDKSLMKFISGRDEYSYDGNDFLAFDDVNKRWIAPVDLAVPTKRKWDDVKMLNDYTQGYLERECVNWLSKFVDYGQEQLKNSIPPELHVFAKKGKNPTIINLHCMATGFLPKEVTLNIRRDGKVVDHLDGMKTTGVRPNGDGTYQIMNGVEILTSDSAKYSCEVIHRASNIHRIEFWDSEPPGGSGNIGAIIGGVLGGIGLVLSVAAVIYKLCVKRRQERTTSKDSGLAEEGSLGDEEMKNLNAKSETSSHSSDSGLAGERNLEEVDQGKEPKDSSETGRDSGQGSRSSTPESERLLGVPSDLAEEGSLGDEEMKNLNGLAVERNLEEVDQGKEPKDSSETGRDSGQGSRSSTPDSKRLLGVPSD